MRLETFHKGFFIFCLLGCGALLWTGAQPLPSGHTRTGADRLLEEPYRSWIRGKRLGLITNHTGLTRQFASVVEVLEDLPDVQVAALFAPEHGLHGQAQAGERVESTRRVFSLYGEHRSPTPEMLADLDVLVYDIQDVGVRFYTFISTLFETLKAAGSQPIPIIVLDRPAPLNGSRVEGPMLETGMESFVGIFRLPVRYGLTVGELARLFNAQAQLGADLKVVPLAGWTRDLWFDQTGLPWIPPSPNMPTLDTATVYPGFCLVEGTNLSEGRGSTRPFELVGAPWLDADRLTVRLNQLQLPGVHFRPQAFTPTFSKHRGENCNGVQVHVLDRNVFQPVETVIHFLAEVRRLHPDQLQISESFDRLAGNRWIRRQLLEGRAAAKIVAAWQEDLAEFARLRKQYLAYP